MAELSDENSRLKSDLAHVSVPEQYSAVHISTNFYPKVKSRNIHLDQELTRVNQSQLGQVVKVKPTEIRAQRLGPRFNST